MGFNSEFQGLIFFTLFLQCLLSFYSKRTVNCKNKWSSFLAVNHRINSVQCDRRSTALCRVQARPPLLPDPATATAPPRPRRLTSGLYCCRISKFKWESTERENRGALIVEQELVNLQYGVAVMSKRLYSKRGEKYTRIQGNQKCKH